MATKEKLADAGKRMLFTSFWAAGEFIVLQIIIHAVCGFWLPWQLIALVLVVNLPFFFLADFVAAFSRKTPSRGVFAGIIVIVVAQLLFIAAVLYTPLGKMLSANQVGVAFLVIPLVFCMMHFIYDRCRKK